MQHTNNFGCQRKVEGQGHTYKFCNTSVLSLQTWYFIHRWKTLIDIGTKRSKVKVKLTYSAMLCCKPITQTVLSLQTWYTSYIDGGQRKKDTYRFWGQNFKGQGPLNIQVSSSHHPASMPFVTISWAHTSTCTWNNFYARLGVRSISRFSA